MASTTHDTSTIRPRRRSIVGPLILIGVGVLLLAQNFGLVSSSVWASIAAYWPVLLILLGLEIILGRGSLGSAILVTVLTVVIGGIGAFAAYFPWSTSELRTGPFVPVETVEMAEEIGSIRQASYELQLGSGSVDVSALSSDTGRLFLASLQRDEPTAIDRTVGRDGETAKVTIRARDTRKPVGTGNSSGSGQWTLRLSPAVASSLDLSTGAGDSTLSLKGLSVTKLDLSTGAGKVRLELPVPAGNLDAKVSAGVGDLEVVIPAGTAAQIHVSTGVGSVDVDESRFQKVDKNTYQTTDYATASNRVTLKVSSGVGETVVK